MAIRSTFAGVERAACCWYLECQLQIQSDIGDTQDKNLLDDFDYFYSCAPHTK